MLKTFRCIFTLLIAFSIVASTSTVLQAQAISLVTTIVNGNVVQSDVDPVIRNGRTLVPIRMLSALDVEYLWDDSNKSATVKTKDGRFASLTLNEKTALVNNKPVPSGEVVPEQRVTLDAPVTVMNGRILVPLRFISETFGFQVHYEGERAIVFIHSIDFRPDVEAAYAKDLTTARSASILLPWNKSFQSLDASTKNENGIFTYHYPKGEYDRYFYTNGSTLSYVEISDGKAHLKWQGAYGSRADWAQEVGQQPGDFDTVLSQTVSVSHTKENKVRYGYSYTPSHQLKEIVFTSYSNMAQHMIDEVKKP